MRTATIVYFLSDERLTGDDVDSSTDLYRWTQARDSLTLVSKADNAGNLGEPGNSDCLRWGPHHQPRRCHAQVWGHDLHPVVLLRRRGKYGNAGGNCLSDNSIAADSGDIYFLSPEQLDGTRGIPNQENLYVFRNGASSTSRR